MVFADIGDMVEVAPADGTSLSVIGAFASAVPGDTGNLALRAARYSGASVAVTLEKVLPPGAGIGGGSSDAAAVLRGVSMLTGVPPHDPLALGADVPVCLSARPARMRGIGERLDLLPPLPAFSVVLVYPGVAVSTGAAFDELARVDGAPLPQSIPFWRTAVEMAGWLEGQRNDLEQAAMIQAPLIREAKAALAAERACLLARMSGSGSTVVGLFEKHDAARAAAGRLAAGNPGWWVRAARALTGPPELQERRDTT